MAGLASSKTQAHLLFISSVLGLHMCRRTQICLLHYLFMYLNVCVYIHICVSLLSIVPHCTHHGEHMGIGGQRGGVVSFLPPWVLTQVTSLGSSAFTFFCFARMLGNPNSGLHACMAGTSLTEPVFPVLPLPFGFIS